VAKLRGEENIVYRAHWRELGIFTQDKLILIHRIVEIFGKLELVSIV
jgi:hypothetical protein